MVWVSLICLQKYHYTYIGDMEIFFFFYFMDPRSLFDPNLCSMNMSHLKCLYYGAGYVYTMISGNEGRLPKMLHYE